MLSQPEVLLFSIAVLIVLPLALYSLSRGSQPPASGVLAKYYAVEKRLSLVGDLFLLAVCASGLTRLAAHFNLISAETFAWLAFVVGVPFGLLLVLFLALWIKAVVTLRRQRRTTA